MQTEKVTQVFILSKSFIRAPVWREIYQTSCYLLYEKNTSFIIYLAKDKKE